MIALPFITWILEIKGIHDVRVKCLRIDIGSQKSFSLFSNVNKYKAYSGQKDGGAWGEHLVPVLTASLSCLETRGVIEEQ